MLPHSEGSTVTQTSPPQLRPQTSEHWHLDQSTELPTTEGRLGLLVPHEAPKTEARSGVYPDLHVPLNCSYITAHHIPQGWGHTVLEGPEPTVSPLV